MPEQVRSYLATNDYFYEIQNIYWLNFVNSNTVHTHHPASCFSIFLKASNFAGINSIDAGHHMYT